MNFAIKVIYLLSSVISFLSATEPDTTDTIKLDFININEELESNYLILNFTDLILNRLDLLRKNPDSIRLESIKFDQNDNLNEYFSIDLKKYRLQEFDDTVENKSSIILLRTSSKKLDREYLCRLDLPNCSCEDECFLNLNLIANFANNYKQFEIKLSLPIFLSDLNDNKPFFYQPEVIIDLDQIGISNDDKILRIPLKLASDLDSTKPNQVLNYELEKVSFTSDNYASLEFNNSQLDLIIDLSKINNHNLDYLNDKFKLAAMDSKFKVYQTLIIKYKIPKVPKTKSLIKNEPPSPRVTQQQFSSVISIVSAINDIEIQYSNTSDSYEIKLKSDTKTQIFVSNKSDQLVTLAYYIVEKNKLNKNEEKIELASQQFIQSSILNTEYSNDLFRIDEMRNGLYSISIKSNQYDKIIKSKKDELKVNYNLKLTTKILNKEIVKTIALKIPVNLLLKNKIETSTLKNLIKLNPTENNLSIQNYLIIVSIACAVLVAFAIVCVSISLICCCLNKFKENGQKVDNKKLSPIEINGNNPNANIMVYDVLPQKSLSSSSSSSCSSNLSPVTTTTTSVANDQILSEQKTSNPLFDTHLNTEWYHQPVQTQNSSPSASSPLSSSSSCNLIKPVDEVNKYKNDLYRNSHVLYKQKQIFQQQQQQQQNYFNLDGNNNLGNPVYQAKPVNLLNNSLGSSSGSYSLINEVNLNSMDNVIDSIKEKMQNRLNEVLVGSNPNCSAHSFGQISCV
ncbi:unnamed protein product [Brachionus calyciflorus]|uniref:Uncharacterized protein n=1 Tax=Brachionus calyciflorus TaxID=104777 RepID=A0A813TWI9_9BILA|nr:unnamed protein product [Brachionus calyciflorus]